MAVIFSLEGVSFRYGATPVLREASFSLGAAELVSIAGPNGAGKSTLMGILAGMLDGYEGSCRFLGREVRSWKRRAMARELSFVPQSLRLEFPFTAEQVVLMGRTPYCDGLFESPGDWDAVERAMRLTDTEAFRQRDFRELSGGERQRVVLAAALAQSPRVLLLDEPTTFLDLKHQLSIYELLRNLAREGLLVVAVTHDLNLASAYADRLLILDGGRLRANAPPEQVIEPRCLSEVFGVEAEVRRGPAGRPWVLYGH